MKTARLVIPGLAAAGILLSAVFTAAFPHHFSSTRSFSFDGSRYTLLPSGGGDFSLVRRELAKTGIDLPRDSEEDPPPHPALSFALAPEGEARHSRRLPIPGSFGIEHTLRLESDGGDVEIVSGTTRLSRLESMQRLKARGWSCPAIADPARNGSIATYTRGKERLLAFLEAEEGRFLLVRRMDR